MQGCVPVVRNTVIFVTALMSSSLLLAQSQWKGLQHAKVGNGRCPSCSGSISQRTKGR
jgi:hypothetical protein